MTHRVGRRLQHADNTVINNNKKKVEKVKVIKAKDVKEKKEKKEKKAIIAVVEKKEKKAALECNVVKGMFTCMFFVYALPSAFSLGLNPSQHIAWKEKKEKKGVREKKDVKEKKVHPPMLYAVLACVCQVCMCK
jgi:hypothetical protein